MCATPEPTFLNSRRLRVLVCFLAAKPSLRWFICPAHDAGVRRLDRPGALRGPSDLESRFAGETPGRAHGAKGRLAAANDIFYLRLPRPSSACGLPDAPYLG